MSITLGLVANIYQEANALPGWLELHTPYFNDVRVVHAGPQGVYSNDGTIEILEKWKIPILYTAIDEGFGVVRTLAMRSSPCDYTMLLDADERFYPLHRHMTCSGESTSALEVDSILASYDFHDLKTVLPNWENVSRLGAKLHVDFNSTYDQGERLREILETERPDAVCTIRRHWHDLSFTRPTQNWHEMPDWQMRIVRNHPDIYFDPNIRMHERLVGAQKIVHADMRRGPFFDHAHLFFKKMEIEQRSHDIAIYNRIHASETPPTLDEFRGLK